MKMYFWATMTHVGGSRRKKSSISEQFARCEIGELNGRGMLRWDNRGGGAGGLSVNDEERTRILTFGTTVARRIKGGR
jgi:hypothetical protein